MHFGTMGMGPLFWQIAVVRFTAYFHPFSPQVLTRCGSRKLDGANCKRGWEKRSELNNDSENLEAAAAELSNAIHLVTCCAYLHTDLPKIVERARGIM